MIPDTSAPNSKGAHSRATERPLGIGHVEVGSYFDQLALKDSHSASIAAAACF
jgi:hypothetical protein